MWLIYGRDPVFGIHECGSDDKVLDSLASRMVGSGRKQRVLGLIVDADLEGVAPGEVIKARLDQLAARAGIYYPLPNVFPDGGLIVDPLASRPDADRLPRRGVWLMPNNKTWGMFEDLLMHSLSDHVAEYSERVVRQSKVDGVANYSDAHLSKAVIRTYMAWQDPPDIQYLGLAIKRGVFERIETECRQFVDWLDRLFGSHVAEHGG